MNQITWLHISLMSMKLTRKINSNNQQTHTSSYEQKQWIQCEMKNFDKLMFDIAKKLNHAA